MELILNCVSMFQSFANEWKLRWVPAVMRYCKSLKKKEVVKALSTANDLYSSGIYTVTCCTFWNWEQICTLGHGYTCCHHV